MNRIQATIRLAGASWRVLKQDKELLWLPVLSGLATIAVALTFVLPFADTFAGDEGAGPVTYIVMFVMYVVLAFITIFFNAALIHAANERFDGGDPTVGSALAGAWSQVGRILPWAIVSATVSIILQSIEERAGALGRIVVGLVGLAWSLVTFLVLPILVVEQVGVRDAVRRSVDLFKATWGENVAARVGFGLLGFLAVLPAVPVIALGIAAGGAIAVLAVVVGVVWMIAASVVIAALSGIFQTALYRYAADGGVGSEFSESDMSAAFAPRRSGF
jgi:hypothetical protein